MSGLRRPRRTPPGPRGRRNRSEVAGDQAHEWLRLPTNPNGRTNADVLKPWINGNGPDPATGGEVDRRLRVDDVRRRRGAVRRAARRSSGEPPAARWKRSSPARRRGSRGSRRCVAGPSMSPETLGIGAWPAAERQSPGYNRSLGRRPGAAPRAITRFWEPPHGRRQSEIRTRAA